MGVIDFSLYLQDNIIPYGNDEDSRFVFENSACVYNLINFILYNIISFLYHKIIICWSIYFYYQS